MGNAVYPFYKGWKANGTAPASSYLLYTYDSGTTNPKATYSDTALTIPNANPIVLNASGEATIFLAAGSYRFDLKTPAGSLVNTFDPITSSGTGIQTVGLIADLKSLSPQENGSFVNVLGYNSNGDGGGGPFYWDALSSASENGGTIFEANSAPALGRWKRIYSGPINVKYFGAVGDGIVVDNTAIGRAITFIGTASEDLYYPDGTYLITSALTHGINTRVIMAQKAFWTSSTAQNVTVYQFDAGRSRKISGSITLILNAGACEYVCPEWFGADTTSLDNTAAFIAALAAASNATGIGRPGILRTAGGVWVCTGTITMPTRIVIWEGVGADKTTMRHNPATFTDFVTGDTAGEGFVGFRDIRFCSNSYQHGKTRYLISYGNFNENSFISNVQMRDSVGFLKITNGYLSTIRNLRCQSATPNATLAGITNVEWAQVWDDGHAPIQLNGMNGSTIDGLHLYRISSEVVGGLTPASPILLTSSQALTIRGIQIEGQGTYTDGGTYVTKQKSLIISSVTGLTIDGWYMEANYCTEHIFHAKSGSQAFIRGITGYNFDCDSALFQNESLWDLKINTGMFYKCRAPYLYKVVQSGYSLQGQIIFDNFMVSPGNIYTDTVLSADTENVNDTYGTGAGNLSGVADQDDLSYSLKRLCTPKRNTGLVVTAGSDPTYTGIGVATGDYIQITGGVFFNEAGRLVIVKRSTGNPLTTNLAVFRLRPPNATKYYRLYISEAGSPYLLESAGAFADDKGNWIAQFRTNGATKIVKYSDGVTLGLDADPYNQRLAINGLYVPNQNTIQTVGSAIPITGQWIVGDFIRNNAPALNAPFGWVCITAGTPGTWQTIEDPTFIKLAKSFDGTLEVMQFVNEDSTAASTNEAIRFHYRFRGGGSASNRTAGYMEIRKIGDFGTTPNMDARIVLCPSSDETPFDALDISQEGIKMLQPTIGSMVASMKSTATNDDPEEQVYQGRVATTDATQTTINTFTIPASTTVMIEARVIARRTGGAAGTAEDGAGYILSATVKNVAGVATLIGAVAALATQESQAAWDATIVVSGATALLRVTGAASNNVTWHATVRTYSVST